ncbi:MAG: Trk system potassium transporter TrkA [Desulfobacterales bacterium]|nr:Trk system potassium transporter TrkA [Desulfobacterales bacterium]
MKIVIIGAGEVGFHIASRLALENKDVVVVDKNPEVLKRITETIDAQTLCGSGSDPAVLEEAGIKDAQIMLSVTDSDEGNLVACLMADTLSPATKKLARLRDAAYDGYHETFRTGAPHIDRIINPDVEVVRTIERLMDVPGAVDVAEFGDGRIKFVGIRMDGDCPLNGVRLDVLPRMLGPDRPLIAAIVREDRLIIPKGRHRLHAGDLVYFISEEKKLFGQLAVFGKHATPVRHVLIVGGGRIGYRLARRLEQRSLSCKIIEKRADQCDVLAEKLEKTTVLLGDGSDQSLLMEESIHHTDVVVTLTGDEETNVLASLLAKRLGVGKTITQISKFSYFPLMATIGIEQVVSPRLSAINSILRHIRRGKVLSSISLKGEEGEILEAVALPTSDIVSKPLKKISFPKGAMVAGILRKETVIIPDGDSVIEPEDRIIIFAVRKAVNDVERILTVKLEYF